VLGPERPFPDAKAIGLDIETTGLDFTRDQVLLITLSDGDDAIHLYPEEIDGDWLRTHVFDRQVVIHNALFDLPWLDYHYGCGYPEVVWDTMVAEQMLTAGLVSDEQKKMRKRDDEQVHIPLKDLTVSYLGVELDKSVREQFINRDPDLPLTPEELGYAEQDVLVLVPIARQQWSKIVRSELAPIWGVEQDASPVFSSMVRTGIFIDEDVLRPLIAEAEAKRDEVAQLLVSELTYYEHQRRIAIFDEKEAERHAYQQLEDAARVSLEREWGQLWDEWDLEAALVIDPDEWKRKGWDKQHAGTNGKPVGQNKYVKDGLKTWRTDNPRPPKPHLNLVDPINLNSHPQVKGALEQMLGVVLPNTRSETIVSLTYAESDPRKRSILEKFQVYAKEQKFVSSFGENLLALRGADGWLHPGFNQYGAETGRPSCEGPNLLNIPKKSKVRRAFKPRPGYVFVKADFSQMELRLFAQLSGDPVLREIFRNGEDAHTGSAKRMFGVDEVTPDQRRVAKTINFLVLYQGGVKTFVETMAQDQIYYTESEARKFITTWRSTFNVGWGWVEKHNDLSLKKGFSRTALGRRRFGSVEKGGYAGHVQRALVNHIIQGSNADITKVAMSAVQRLLDPLGGRLLLNVYDETVSEVPIEHARLAAQLVKEAMEESARLVLTDVPAVVDVHICHSWDEDDVVGEEELDAAVRLVENHRPAA
jgi:DNA polymerase I-like protein with 3'-5' exonuclease and polymerase domains